MFSAVRLNYEAADLSPLMSEEAIDYHYGRHYAAYLRGVNEAILGTELETRPLEIVVEHARIHKRPRLLRNAGQAWNHGFFFAGIAKSKQMPSAKLGEAVVDTYGAVEQFNRQFVAAGSGHFASGWLWLTANRQGELAITTTKNATPCWLAAEVMPLAVCDLWEHAYYIDWRNDRGGFLKEFVGNWINWDLARAQYDAVTSGAPGWRHP